MSTTSSLLTRPRDLVDFESVDAIANSPLFDHEYYVAHYPSLKNLTRIEAARHYVHVGSNERKQPSRHFNAQWYSATYSDVSECGPDPLLHYIRVGAVEGRDPSPDFLTDWYRSYYPEVSRSDTIPIYHYIQIGQHEGRLCRPPNSGTQINRFDSSEWAVFPSSVSEGNLSFMPGHDDGEDILKGEMLNFVTATGDFDEWSYLYYNSDVAVDVAHGNITSGLDHFLRVGRDEYRTGTRIIPPTVRELSYRLRNPDVAHALTEGQFRTGFHHWQEVGRREELSGLRQSYSSGAPLDTEFNLSSWRDGYVILPNMFSAAECDRVTDMVERTWTDRARIDLPINMDIFLDQVDGNKQTLVRAAPEEAYNHPFKINNLYFWSPVARNMVLNERLCRVLRRLLGGDPAVMTSLNFRKGSQQALHLDTFYMPSVIPYRMVAAWIALEDVHEESGPLSYVPGTNRIPPYYFPGHRLWTNNSPQEYDAFDNYFYRRIDEYGLKREKLVIKKGDVLIWHSLLLHGGEEILNTDLTRFSMVAHYFVAADYPGGSSTKLPFTRLKQHSWGRYYEDRWPQFEQTHG